MRGRLLTIAEVAELLGCAPATVKRRIRLGELPAFRDVRIVRIREHDLDAYIAGRTVYPAQPAPRSPCRASLPELRPGETLFDLPDPLA